MHNPRVLGSGSAFGESNKNSYTYYPLKIRDVRGMVLSRTAYVQYDEIPMLTIRSHLVHRLKTQALTRNQYLAAGTSC